MRIRGTARLTAAAAAAVLVLSACGSDDGDGDAQNDQQQEQQETGAGEDDGADGDADEDGDDRSSEERIAEDEARSIEGDGLDGVWESIVDDNDIETLTITGGTVETTGPLSCPGTVSEPDSAEPVIELDCEVENTKRVRGTLELSPEGNRLYIGWDGEAWGGYIDSLIRIG
ncbi:hypothetical protein MTQ13_22145 [Streptomyces sp. XM4011]|uniref:hypothetical protein n=1 Tax=Streptomyces sp. XM4011 TaxID=2929780 RepID=UPI001FFC114A|nr:hypothetical protein [Streptomyces sp. XM4011]MCK1816946.1 hypothetical protein [Streptomyces sp. XM4011]